ncbi:MAG: 23S rRNA (pseudouridine(1915)-N(3))-methyltransferase RlmH [Gammaproteobacteria bacterium]|nr:23S rRNA (pseudouridine(1915)-N(3))-methyltransferase RlmH [Gammaproteobacteria bacterium]NND53379.1 23S rRNA (pseudouridine(1915)-N(3))-methyltransferase RlmH [Gammaproteobacteria bacterium]
MRINVLAVGTRMPSWVTTGTDTYVKRLPRHIDLRFTEIPAAPRTSGATPQKILTKEGDALLKAARDADYVIALDERGKSWNSRQLADELQIWMNEYPRVALLVGGADGLDPRCRAAAQRTWSLSALTLPHPLVRVVLAEQLYRAWTLLQGHPYHRE